MKRIYELTDFAPTPAALAVQETLFHTANGYLGVRGTLEEGLPAGCDTMRGTYINGFYDIVPMKQAEPLCGLPEEKETMLNAADTQTLRITLDGEEFSLFSGTVLHIARTLDMDAGVSVRRVLWRSPKGREAELEFRRMASFANRSLFTIDCRVTPKNFSGPVEIRSTQEGLVRNYANRKDPRMGAESRLLLHPVRCVQEDGAVYLGQRHLQKRPSGLQRRGAHL
jgi:alpha,alpha-trehalose phosphorylase